MDIILNDGTRATNVSVWEYEQLKEKGLVGNQHVSQQSNVSFGSSIPDVPLGTCSIQFKRSETEETPIKIYQDAYAVVGMHTCYHCGKTKPADEMCDYVLLSNPPIYQCKDCVGKIK